MTTIEDNYSSSIKRPEIFPLTTKSIDCNGLAIRIWSGPGSRLIATLIRPDGTIRSISPMQICNALNPDEDPVTLHNRILLAPDTVSWDFVYLANGILQIWPKLKAAGWRDALPKASGSVSGLARLARGRSQEQICEWFYTNGYKASSSKEGTKVEIHLPRGGHAGTYNIHEHETIRNLLRQGGYIKNVHYEPSTEAEIQDRQIGRGIVFQHPKDKNQNTFNVDFSRVFRNGQWDREQEGGYHIDVKGPHLKKASEKVKVSTQETYLVNREARQSGQNIRYTIRTSAFVAAMLGHSLFGATPAAKQFHQTLQQTKLTESYNANHSQNPIPAKGGTGGTIGGVACSQEYIEGLFDNSEALFEQDHYFCVPLHTKGKPPFTEGELRQVLRELAIGIYAHSTVPFFSLHFRQKSADLFPVIHPVYENTLVGRVISMLDYFMKGYLNGVIFTSSFNDQWYQDPSWERKSSSAWQALVNLERYCQENLEGADRQYRSLREVVEEQLAEKLKDLDLPATLSNFEGFKNSFRIIAKQKSFKKTGNVFEIDADFDVFYTIEPSPEYKKEMDLYLHKHGQVPPSHQILDDTYKFFAKRIHDHMVKLPFCRDYFSMLGVINFFSSYFSTLKAHRKIPILPLATKVRMRGSPPLFPHLPLNYTGKEPLRNNPREIIERLLNAHREEMTHYFSKTFDELMRGRSIEDSKRLRPQETERLLQMITGEVEGNGLKHASAPFKRVLQQQIQQQFRGSGRPLAEQLFNRISEALAGVVRQYNAVPRDRRASKQDVLSGFFNIFKDSALNRVIDCTESIPYKIMCLQSELPSQVVNKNARIVGGCGMQLQEQAVQSSKEALFLLQRNWKALQELEPESWMPVQMRNGQKSVVFRLLHEDVPPWITDDYAWMETSLLNPGEDENGNMTEARLHIQKAMDARDHEEFVRLIEGVPANDLSNMRNQQGASLLCRAATMQDSFYTRTLLGKGLSPHSEDFHGYRAIHYAAMSGCVHNLHLFIEADPSSVNARSKNGSTPLIVAIQNSQIEVMTVLLNAGSAPS
ncbi:MAG: ankyrin repeat domain-containing protein, partial [Chlamydiales bacterium]